MNSKTLPADFHWVVARSKCSIQQIFAELELGVRDDVDKAQSLVPPNEMTKFFVSKSGNRFGVTHLAEPHIPPIAAVTFSCVGDGIHVSRDGEKEPFLVATLTLNNDGECKLKVGRDELDQWHFRRMALEHVFFGPL
jgi:hypothetical protein